MATVKYGINFTELVEEGVFPESLGPAMVDFVKSATGPDGHRVTVAGAMKDFNAYLQTEIDRLISGTYDYMEMNGYFGDIPISN